MGDSAELFASPSGDPDETLSPDRLTNRIPSESQFTNNARDGAYDLRPAGVCPANRCQPDRPGLVRISGLSVWQAARGGMGRDGATQEVRKSCSATTPSDHGGPAAMAGLPIGRPGSHTLVDGLIADPGLLQARRLIQTRTPPARPRQGCLDLKRVFRLRRAPMLVGRLPDARGIRPPKQAKGPVDDSACRRFRLSGTGLGVIAGARGLPAEPRWPETGRSLPPG